MQLILTVDFDPADFFSNDEIFVGFTAGTGRGADNHDIMDFSLEQTTTETCDPSPMCPPDERPTKGKLNKCWEQEKCFSITYKKMKDMNDVCDTAGCDFKWKVCLNINDNNPCCEKKKKVFRNACIRGDSYKCLDDEDSLSYVDPIENLMFGDEYCEIVAPGEKALFQLVSMCGTRRIWAMIALTYDSSGSTWIHIFVIPSSHPTRRKMAVAAVAETVR